MYLFLAVLGVRFCARAFSSCGKWGPLFIAVRGPLTIAASLVAEHRLQMRRLSSCGSRAQLLRGMWDLPRPGLEPVSPALAGRLSTTAPPGKPGTLIHCWWECKLVQPLWKVVWKFLKKLKMELPYDPAIPLLSTYSKKMRTLTEKVTCTPMFIAALLTITKIWKQPKCPSTDEWIKKIYIYICVRTHAHTHTQWHTTQP